MQQWFNLSDLGVEEALHQSPVLRRFVGVDLGAAAAPDETKNRSKSSVRAKVEYPFRMLKRIFGFDMVRYRGLAKNHHRLCACFALTNL